MWKAKTRLNVSVSCVARSKICIQYSPQSNRSSRSCRHEFNENNTRINAMRKSSSKCRPPKCFAAFRLDGSCPGILPLPGMSRGPLCADAKDAVDDGVDA